MRIAGLTLLALAAFAGNSLLCRAALRDTAIDAASFTALRIASGALALALLAGRRAWIAPSPGGPGRRGRLAGSWGSALALVVYAAGFSWAYRDLSAATGALLLFGVVQATMIATGLATGERFSPVQWLGLLAALGGLVAMLLPGVVAPSPRDALLMTAAGVAWAVYTLRGRRADAGVDPTATTAGNFVRGVVPALAVSAAAWLAGAAPVADARGAALALVSGAITSGVGYAVWYAALRGLGALQAAVVQLGVPVLTTIGGVALLGERPTLGLGLASVAVLGGVATVIVARRR